MSERSLTKVKVSETMIKSAIKDLLAYKGVFNWPVVQALGAYKGVPDRILHYKGKVVYLEIKKPLGKMSEHQEAFQKQCRADRITYWVVYSVEDLMRLLKD